MKNNSSWIWASLLAGGFLMPMKGSASEPALRQAFPGVEGIVSTHNPAAAKEQVPWYSLPDRFLFTGNYFAHLSITEMRIDHVADNSRCTRKNRVFTISASYQQPIGNRLFSSGFELPIFFADRLSVTRLAPASVGDYVVHLSNTPLYGAASQLLISARF